MQLKIIRKKVYFVNTESFTSQMLEHTTDVSDAITLRFVVIVTKFQQICKLCDFLSVIVNAKS